MPVVSCKYIESFPTFGGPYIPLRVHTAEPDEPKMWSLFGPFEFLLLYCHKYLIGNEGVTGAGIEVPLHEAIIFGLVTQVLIAF